MISLELKAAAQVVCSGPWSLIDVHSLESGRVWGVGTGWIKDGSSHPGGAAEDER